MPIMISLLRGVNLGGYHKIKMDDLRALYESLKLRDPQTYAQSGNVVFRTNETDQARLSKRIEQGIEKKFGFHSDVILRTDAKLREVIAQNPFARRPGIEPNKLTVTFFAQDLRKETCAQILGIKCNPEEIKLRRHEFYVYFAGGIGGSKLTPVLDKILKRTGTFRNWNTVTRLLEMTEKLEAE